MSWPLLPSTQGRIRNESAECFRLSPDKVAVDSPTKPLHERAMTPFIASDIAPDLEQKISELLGTFLDLDSVFQRMDSELPFTARMFGKKEEAETFGQWALKLTKMITDHIVETVGEEKIADRIKR